MKKVLVSAIFISLLIISACNAKTEANLPNGYVQITSDKVPDGELTVVKHITTDCYYTYMDGSYSGAFTQMFIEKDGQSVPYCEN